MNAEEQARYADRYSMRPCGCDPVYCPRCGAEDTHDSKIDVIADDLPYSPMAIHLACVRATDVEAYPDEEEEVPAMFDYTYTEITPDQISSLDLRDAVRDQMVTVYRVTVYTDKGASPESGELVIFDNDRFGFAWGADAAYGDVTDQYLRLDSGHTMPLPF